MATLAAALRTIFLISISQIPQCSSQPQISIGRRNTCAVWFGQLKCWGFSKYADPAYTTNMTDECIPIPPIEPFDLGDNFTAKSVASGRNHNCAISMNGAARCWGAAAQGQLGYGNTDLFSNATNFGKNVDLGTGFIIESASLGKQHSCFLSTSRQIKCFGSNTNGKLGLGDTENRGDDISEMGDNLSAIDLGDDFSPKQIALGAEHSCALSINSTVKCWGENLYGQLGYGDAENRGDETGEMGDNLEEIDFADFLPVRIVAGGYHSCAISGAKEMLCWGVFKNVLYVIDIL